MSNYINLNHVTCDAESVDYFKIMVNNNRILYNIYIRLMNFECQELNPKDVPKHLVKAYKVIKCLIEGVWYKESEPKLSEGYVHRLYEEYVWKDGKDL